MTTKRADILEATLELISMHGFHGTAMSAIAERANVGAGTIYRYFDNKEDLITQLYLEVEREKGAAYFSCSADLPLRERFRTLWLNTLHYYLDHPRETAFIEQFDNSPYVTAEIRESLAEYYEPLLRFIKDAFREGVFKEMPLAMLRTFTLDAALSVAKQHASGALTLDEATQELAVEMCWDALARKE